VKSKKAKGISEMSKGISEMSKVKIWRYCKMKTNKLFQKRTTPPTPFPLKSFTFYLLTFSFLLLLACSKNGTDGNDNTITVSGKVTLEGQSDHSGVKVMLFNPIAIDTVLTNLNSRYSNVGIEANQRTEFYWWEHTPAYQTTTGGDGSWSIDNVADGTYHVVAERAGYGWKVIYNAPYAQNNVQLEAVFQLSGTIVQDLTFTTGKHVVISGSVVFNQGRKLTIEPNVTVEFANNGKLEINGLLLCNGTKGNEVYLVSRESANTSRVRLNLATNSTVNYVCIKNLSEGLLLSGSDSTTIMNSRFNNGQDAITLFNSKSVKLQNNYVSDMNSAIVSDASGKNEYEKNIIVNIIEFGLDAFNEDNSLIQNNVFKNCGDYGIAINPTGAPGSILELQNFVIHFNDFVNNQNHIKVGRKAFCIVDQNNFLKEQDYAVWVAEINSVDTLNFKDNYWGYTDPVQIGEKIFDKLDQPNATNPVPIVDFSGYKFNYINW
jgi:hypothetical protein